MHDIPTPLVATDVEIQQREQGYNGFFSLEKLTLRHRAFDGRWIGPMTRELFRRGNAVCVLLYDPIVDCVVLTEQFRIGALTDSRSPWLLELVAGMVEDGESDTEVAEREMWEEAQCQSLALLPICRYWVSPGGSDEQVQLYCALIDSTGVGGVHGLADEHEDIRLVTLSRQRCMDALHDGVLNNAATVIALQWLALQDDTKRQQWQADVRRMMVSPQPE